MKPIRMIKHPTLLAILLLLPLWVFADETAEVFSTTSDGVEVQMFIPATGEPIRGVLVHAANYKLKPGDRWEELGRSMHFAHVAMNMNLKRTNRPKILRGALDAALAEFAEKSGHRELVHAPFIGTGHSAGGMVAAVLSTTPERTITYCLSCSWVVDAAKVGPEAARVPALFTIGSVPDAFKMLPAIPEKFDPARKQDAPWAVALMWGVGHDFGNSATLFIPWMQAITALRLPAEASADAPPKLREVKVEEGWLGDRASWESNLATVVPRAEYKGDKAAAVWLPNRAVAFVWRALMSKDPPAVLEAATGDGKTKLAPAKSKAERDMIIDSGQNVTLSLTASAGFEPKRVQYFDGDKLLGEASQSPWTFEWKAPGPSPHAVFAQWEDATRKPGVTNPALVIVRRSPAAQKP